MDVSPISSEEGGGIKEAPSSRSMVFVVLLGPVREVMIGCINNI